MRDASRIDISERETAKHRKNILWETKQLETTCNGSRFKLAGLAFKLFARNINHKIIFGTDWPVSKTLNGHKKTMDAFLHPEGPLARVSDVQRRWIMLENIQRVLPARTDAALVQHS
ncbi:hypothetical protein HHL21_06145 [Massilia sp. RP-1-19]|uniref:Amidohydrolase-related domain-containing protein n=1 Tax=Massilia polaris TaxID=2728846 RepID=A0A848HHG9_9BURK|nr:hypothetical protein [Massilia polaris]NML60674.1 hypothetical protein [Massilia polaris]